MTRILKPYYVANLVNNEIIRVEAFAITSSGALEMAEGHYQHYPTGQVFTTWKQARTWLFKERREQWKALKRQMDILSWQLDEARDWEEPE